MSVGHLLLSKHVASAFIFSDLINIWIDTKFVQSAAEEHHVGCQAIDEQFARRWDNDLIARRRYVVFLVKTKLHVCIYLLARRAKNRYFVMVFFGCLPPDSCHVYV